MQAVNHRVLHHLHPEQVEVEIWRAAGLEVRRGLSAELDEMRSYVRSKANPRWLWHAMNHHKESTVLKHFPLPKLRALCACRLLHWIQTEESVCVLVC